MPPKKKSASSKCKRDACDCKERCAPKKSRNRKPRSRSVNTFVQPFANQFALPPGGMQPFAKGWSTISPITYQMPPPPMQPRDVPVSGGNAIGGMSITGHTLGGSAERSRLVRETRQTTDTGVDPEPTTLMKRDDVREELKALGLPVQGKVEDLRTRLMEAIYPTITVPR